MKVTRHNIKERANSKVRHVWDKKESEKVKSFMSAGMTVRDTARCLQMTDVTMRKLYRHEIETGHAQQVEKVAHTLYSIATNPEHPKCVSAAVFFLKTRARGWSEKLTIQGPDGGAVQFEHRHSVEVRSLSQEQRDSLREILQEVIAKREQGLLAAPDDAEDAEFEEIEEIGQEERELQPEEA